MAPKPIPSASQNQGEGPSCGCAWPALSRVRSAATASDRGADSAAGDADAL
jgi:hypothetical protein